ncbi:RsfA family transcriptional regulator [Lentibacillus halophilus]|uniref:RsfA family transcriptional regulator n=1 Tax=Lentibacillus halophilus TaxID=295065 RepID=A0ABN0ZFC9_9BACI
MNVARQDAWSEDEDQLLAKTVLSYVRDGKTQLEAFQDVAQQLSRTSAACGFRWNAAIRKTYAQDIERAKEDRKNQNRSQSIGYDEPMKDLSTGENPIDHAIAMLEKVRAGYLDESTLALYEKETTIKQLEKENEVLKQQLHHYEQAWREMGKLWNWVRESKQ